PSYLVSDMMGGGGRSFDGLDFDNITFNGTQGADEYNATNEYGSYEINSGAAISGNAQEFLVVATANTADSTEIQVRVCPDTQVMGDVDGGAPDACP
ncbi:MAG: hypothetical protein RI564_04980, partial [Gracilimonas sp.]|nr:hypothetical protein [Gracilimonas sp.]